MTCLKNQKFSPTQRRRRVVLTIWQRLSSGVNTSADARLQPPSAKTAPTNIAHLCGRNRAAMNGIGCRCCMQAYTEIQKRKGMRMEIEKRPPGRPASEVRQALLSAATDLATCDKAPTMREMAHRACVGLNAARDTVRNMVRSGQLHCVRERRVPYRNKPVAEYAPITQNIPSGFDFTALISTW